MHFLCLHGKGTNVQVLEVQLSATHVSGIVVPPNPSARLGAVLYQLGDAHTYDFVEGNVLEEAAPGE
jgi:hypothetical protein